MTPFHYLIFFLFFSHVVGRVNSVLSPNSQVPASTLTQISLKTAGKYQVRGENDFKSRESRLSFKRNVYSVVSAQMLSTIIMTLGIMKDPKAIDPK